VTAEVRRLITPTGVLVMSAATMGEDHAGWLAARRWRTPKDQGTRLDHDDLTDSQWNALGYRIGSSEVPSILDLDGVDTPAHVFRNKVHGVSGPVNERMSWGHIFEPAISEEWQRRNRSAVDEIGLVAHVDKPWHQSTIDRRVLHCPLDLGTSGGHCGLEVKNVGYSSAERWKRDLPDRILAQIIHQLYVTGYAHMHYACNIGGNMMKQGVVYAEREAELMAYIVAEVDRFRSEHLLTGVEPDWDTSRKADKLIELDTATHPIRAGELTVAEIGDVMAYAEAAAAKGAATKQTKQLAARLRQLADGAKLVLFGDQPAYSYRTHDEERVDIDALRERHPDAYADPEVVSTATITTLVIDRSYRIKNGDRS
jgi:predicted phage-related endonuclease